MLGDGFLSLIGSAFRKLLYDIVRIKTLDSWSRTCLLYFHFMSTAYVDITHSDA